MAKFLFIVLPQLGHLNPTMAIASGLRKRGHRVAYASGTDIQYPVENEGFEFFQTGLPGVRRDISRASEKTIKYKGLLSNFYLFKMLIEANIQTLDELKTIVKTYQPDILVVDSLTFAGGEIAELFQIPWATISAFPGMVPSKDIPPYTHWGLPPSNNFFIKKFYGIIRIGQKLFFRLFDAELNQIRSSLGLAPIKDCVINTTLSPYLLLMPSCEGFEYKRSDWPPQAHLIGVPSTWRKKIDNDTNFTWINELSQDKLLLYVTLGNFQSFRSLNFFKIVMQAFREEPYQVIMSVGHAVDLEEFKDAPVNFRIERFIPHAKILPRISAAIHHGGFSTSQDIICHGIPSIVVPIGQDLYENARRCTEAGVSIRVPYARLSPQRLREGIRFILQDGKMKNNIKNLQKKFLSMNAEKIGADLLEELAAKRRPVYRDSTLVTADND